MVDDTQDTHVGADIAEPIVVPASAAKQIVTTAVRYALVWLVGALAAKGVTQALGLDLSSILTNDRTVNALASFVVASGLAAWGMLKSKQNVNVQQSLQAKLPNRVARLG